MEFCRTQIKVDSNGIVMVKKSYIGGILLIINDDADFTILREIIRKKLSPKE